MRQTMKFPVDLPIDRIDMYRWATEMTSDDYASYAPAHKAMGSYFHGSRFFMVNVECIATDMLIQHYELIDHGKSHLRFYSARTEGYLFRWIPVSFAVPWEMTLHPVSSHSCELICTIGVEFPSALLRALAWVGAARFFMRRHLAQEGPAFARDLERKFASAAPQIRQASTARA